MNALAKRPGTVIPKTVVYESTAETGDFGNRKIVDTVYYNEIGLPTRQIHGENRIQQEDSVLWQFDSKFEWDSQGLIQKISGSEDGDDLEIFIRGTEDTTYSPNDCYSVDENFCNSHDSIRTIRKIPIDLKPFEYGFAEQAEFYNSTQNSGILDHGFRLELGFGQSPATFGYPTNYSESGLIVSNIKIIENFNTENFSPSLKGFAKSEEVIENGYALKTIQFRIAPIRI